LVSARILLENLQSSDYLNCGGMKSILGAGVKQDDPSQDDLYQQVADTYGASLQRLARAYEADPDARRDLLQDIHLQLWRSLAHFDRRCSLRTWVYRVAHNVATGYVARQRRITKTLVSIEEIEIIPAGEQVEVAANQNQALDRLATLIQKLKPLDRQIIVLYLEGVDAASTAEITGLSAANVAMKVYRIKTVLKRWFHEGASHAG
jgi:RNA polymerase sigma-70 factor (ECF subfamily)